MNKQKFSINFKTDEYTTLFWEKKKKRKKKAYMYLYLEMYYLS